MKLMTVFTFLLLCFSSQSLLAQNTGLNNDKCMDVYRDGTLDLLEAVEDYNDGSLNQGNFSAEVSRISATIRSLRTACFFVESPDIKDCVEDYKAIYQDLRDRVRVRAVLSGNQNRVRLPFGYKVRTTGKIAVRDAVCTVF